MTTRTPYQPAQPGGAALRAKMAAAPKHVVLFSGGHSSGLVAFEVARRYGPSKLVLLNHDINARVEDPDIKRFKAEISRYLMVPITYANYCDPNMDQFDVAMKHKAWKINKDSVLCTHRLKTEPFQEWLAQNDPNREFVYYYGFDLNEQTRITRRIGELTVGQGYMADFPLAYTKHWPRTIRSTREVGIEPPLTYGVFKHANCTGCIKAGRQHWYAVYVMRPDIFEKAKQAEAYIGYSIMKTRSGPEYLKDVEPLFASMKKHGIKPTEHIDYRTFWGTIKKAGFDVEADEGDAKPCMCTF